MICPECGSEMVLRTAGRGKNKGQQFYGCSTYPRCHGIVNIESSEVEIKKENINGSQNTTIEIPIQLRAREKFPGYRARFYETSAIPIELLMQVNNGTIGRKAVNEFNKWRLDYPQINTNNIDRSLKQVILIAEKILYRGRTTLLSPWLEEQLRNYFGIISFSSNAFRPEAYTSYRKTENKTNIWFDGHGTEKDFYENILPEILGENYKNFVIPQVYFSSLIENIKTDDPIFNQRADFVITINNKKIIVELDQEDHIEHSSRDQYRDKLLIESGYEVIRIKNYEIANRSGENLDLLIKKLGGKASEKIVNLEKEDKYVIAVKMCHQIQLTIIEAILSGHVDITRDIHIYFDSKSVNFKSDDIKFILQKTSEDLYQLLDNLADLYELSNCIKPFNIKQYNSEENGILITYSENILSVIPKFVIQDIRFSKSISYDCRPTSYTLINNAEITLLEYFLNYIFRKIKFREGQYETISRALRGEDTIVLLPTGSGKSIAFQLTAMLMPGITIVIDPIISLIDDQIDNLERIGIDRAIGLTSQITDPSQRTKIIQLFGQGEYLFCYIAPERFQTEEFRNSIRSLTTSIPIPLVAIDEAHCVSEWGHDFRTSYLNIGRTSRNYCSYHGIKPCILALTGTASSSVLKLIIR